MLFVFFRGLLGSFCVIVIRDVLGYYMLVRFQFNFVVFYWRSVFFQLIGEWFFVGIQDVLVWYDVCRGLSLIFIAISGLRQGQFCDGVVVEFLNYVYFLGYWFGDVSILDSIFYFCFYQDIERFNFESFRKFFEGFRWLWEVSCEGSFDWRVSCVFYFLGRIYRGCVNRGGLEDRYFWGVVGLRFGGSVGLVIRVLIGRWRGVVLLFCQGFSVRELEAVFSLGVQVGAVLGKIISGRGRFFCLFRVGCWVCVWAFLVWIRMIFLVGFFGRLVRWRYCQDFGGFVGFLGL